MNDTKLIYSTVPVIGTRGDLAAGIASITVPQRNALDMAREIVGFGDAAGGRPGLSYRAPGAAQGHPVVIVYASGRKRTVREWE